MTQSWWSALRVQNGQVNWYQLKTDERFYPCDLVLQDDGCWLLQIGDQDTLLTAAEFRDAFTDPDLYLMELTL